MKMNFGNMREDFIQNITIHNNLFYFSHRCYGLAETKAIFHVFKWLFQPSNSKNCSGQMKFNFTKLREFFIPNTPIIKNLLHVLHSNHRLGEFKISSQVIFPKIYNFIIWVISFKGRFRGDRDDFGEMKTSVLSRTCPVIKTSSIFHTSITIREMQEKRCCNGFYF